MQREEKISPLRDGSTFVGVGSKILVLIYSCGEKSVVQPMGINVCLSAVNIEAKGLTAGLVYHKTISFYFGIYMECMY